jgi:hypothetical protein
MRIWIPLAVLLAIASCKRAPQEAKNELPVTETAAGVDLIDFDWPEAKFSCRAPADWKLEDKRYLAPEKGVSFMGNSSPNAPITNNSKLSHINILKYPESGAEYKTAQQYADSFWQVTEDGKPPKLEKKKIGDNEVIMFHLERPFRKVHSKKIEYMQRMDYAIIPRKDGFYELWHTAPTESYQNTLPIFEAVVRSFKPHN